MTRTTGGLWRSLEALALRWKIHRESVPGAQMSLWGFEEGITVWSSKYQNVVEFYIVKPNGRQEQEDAGILSKT